MLVIGRGFIPPIPLFSVAQIYFFCGFHRCLRMCVCMYTYIFIKINLVKLKRKKIVSYKSAWLINTLKRGFRFLLGCFLGVMLFLFNIR